MLCRHRSQATGTEAHRGPVAYWSQGAIVTGRATSFWLPPLVGPPLPRWPVPCHREGAFQPASLGSYWVPWCLAAPSRGRPVTFHQGTGSDRRHTPSGLGIPLHGCRVAGPAGAEGALVVPWLGTGRGRPLRGPKSVDGRGRSNSRSFRVAEGEGIFGWGGGIPFSAYYRCPACGYWAFNGIECFDCGYRP